MNKSLEKLKNELKTIQEKKKVLEGREKTVIEKITTLEAQEITALMKVNNLSLEELAEIVMGYQPSSRSTEPPQNTK